MIYKDEGSSIKTMLRKLDEAEANIPIYNNRVFTSKINICFSSDERMYGKVFDIKATIGRINKFLGYYSVKNPTEILNMLSKKGLESVNILNTGISPYMSNPDFLLLPSKIVITEFRNPVGFTVMANENPTMRL